MNKAIDFLDKMKWPYKEVGVDQASVETCPFCDNSNFKFFINIGEEKNGLWDCKVCGETGNLFKLAKDFSMDEDKPIGQENNKKSGPQPLPDYRGLHKQLMDNPKFESVLDHLVHDRKLKLQTISDFSIGAAEVKGEFWFIMPSFNSKGEGIYHKSRNLPGTEKKFSSPAGREAPLFNSMSGLKHAVLSGSLFVVEGEMDCISMVNQGYLNTVGVPGANVKKTEWITEIRDLNLKTFVVYDNDAVGQKAAMQMASKLGFDRTKSVLLPSEVNGESVKDITNFFCAGGTSEQFSALVDAAKFFDIEGVYQIDSICDEILTQAENGDMSAEFDTQWPEVNKLVGGFERGDVVGVIASGKIGKSSVCLNLAAYWASKGYNVNNLCLEMKPSRVGRKIISHIEQAYDGPDRTEITPEVIRSAKNKMDSWPGKITLGYTSNHDVKSIMELIRNTYRRYSTDVVIFDNLQMLGRSLEHSAQEMSRISKDFKAIAMELNILLVLIIQPHRVPPDVMVGAHNASGSAAIEKDVDTMISLNRKKAGSTKMIDIDTLEEEEATFLPHMVISVDLCRYGPGGRCVMYFDGGISTLRSLRPEDAQYKSPGIGLIKQEEPVEV